MVSKPFPKKTLAVTTAAAKYRRHGYKIIAQATA
jgi:hypothetical protein